MSRIGKQPIHIPAGVEVSLDGPHVEVKGPKGSLRMDVHPLCSLARTEGGLSVLSNNPDSKQGKSIWGLTRTLVANMIQGVSAGYEKKLEIEGVGYKAAVKDDSLTLSVGFSHPVALKGTEGVAFAVEKNVITVSGLDKQKVGQVAAQIRAVRPPEPYKGKGIRYQGEVVRRKLGKKAAGASK